MTATTLVAGALIVVGVVFLLTSALGVLRLPTFYSRAHAVGKSETVGAIFVIAGLAVENGLATGTPELVLILAFALLANPVAVHAMARAEHQLGEEGAGTEADAPTDATVDDASAATAADDADLDAEGRS